MTIHDLIGFIHVNLLGVVEIIDNAVQNIQASVVGCKPSLHLHNVAGKKVLITGGTSGIGEYTAKAFMQYGANVVITSRSLPRAKAAAKRLADEVSPDGPGPGKIRGMKLDLGSMDDVKRCVEEIKRADDLDVLICNAGIMCPLEHTLTDDHMEVQFQTNHLGHFLLASEVAAHRIRRAASGRKVRRLRVVLVSSVTARAGRMQWDDLQSRGSYVPFRAYAQSKLANVMCAQELQRRCDRLQLRLGVPPPPAPAAGSRGAASLVSCTNTHPGLVNTPLARGYFETDYIPVPWLRPVLAPVLRAAFPLMLLRPDLSVQTMALAALGPAEEVQGKFVESRHAAQVWPQASQPRECARLWAVSLDLARRRDPFV